jgi:hypothetical protein
MGTTSNSQNTTAFSKNAADKLQKQSLQHGLGQSAEVIDIILDPMHPAWDPETFPTRKIGDILARPIIEFNRPNDQLQWYHPIFPNWWSGYPLIGEIVLLIEGIGQKNQQKKKTTEKYYLPPVNIWQDPNNNQLPASSYDVNLLTVTPSEAEKCNPSGQYTGNQGEKEPVDLTPPLGRYFQEMPIIRLQPYEGDVIFEGRFGQSLRFGSTYKTGLSPNFYSAGGENGDPVIVLSNGHRPGTKATIGDQNESDEPIVNHIEDPNQDAAIMFMCNGNSVDIQTISDNWDSYKVKYDSKIEEERKEAGYPETAPPDPFESKPSFEEGESDDKEPTGDEPCKACEDGTIPEKDVNGDCAPCPEQKEEIEESKNAKDIKNSEENKTKSHTCGLDRDLTEELAVEIVLNTISAGKSKNYTDLGWMSSSKRKLKGSHSSGGGECWVGILHWTGRSMKTMYKGMKSKGYIKKYFPNKVTIPKRDTAKGWFYDGAYEGQTVTVTYDILCEFSKNAQTKELNYPWWEKGIRAFVESGSDAKKGQNRGIYKKFCENDNMDKAIVKYGWQTPREYAIAMMFFNSYGAPLYKKWGKNTIPTPFLEHTNGNVEELGKIYCGGMTQHEGGGQTVACCRSRCKHWVDNYPPCKCFKDSNSVHYKPWMFGGCSGERRSSLDGSGCQGSDCPDYTTRGNDRDKWYGATCKVVPYTGPGAGKEPPNEENKADDCDDPNYNKGVDGWKCMSQEDFCVWADKFFRDVNRSFGFQSTLDREEKSLLRSRARGCD